MLRAIGYSAPESELIWSLRLELNTGENKKMTFFEFICDEPIGLFCLLMDYFGTEDEWEEKMDQED